LFNSNAFTTTPPLLAASLQPSAFSSNVLADR
jgi:hypothetical protein